MANLPPELPPSGESVSVEPPPGSCDVSEESPPLAPQDHGCYAQASDGSDSQMHYAMPDRQYRSMRGATPEGTSPRGQEQPDYFIMGRSVLMPGDTDSVHQAPGDNVLPSGHSTELVLGHSSQPAFIEKPTIQSVVRVDGLRGKLKFLPPNHTPARRKVQGYWITSRWEHAGWVEVFDRFLAPDEVLTPEVESIIPLHLLEEASKCQYQVTMLYHDNMKVESDIFTEELDPTDTPVVSVTKNGSSMTLSFSHPPSYPKAALREDLKYKILWKNDPERDNSYPSTSGTSGSVTVSGDQGSSPSFTLRVSYKSRPGLGYIFSEKCEARAKELVEGSLSNDIEPIAIALLFCNDNLEEDVRMKKLHPPYNAQKSCALLKPALQRYGVTVIPVTNESMKCLNAVFENLAARKFSESCELLWFIFCGHGVGNELSLNGQRYECAALIELVSAIGIDKLAFFFDCCKSHCDYIKTIDIKKDYMALCSAPPGQVCYQKDGVSFFVSSLIEVLQNQFEGQLTKLQLEVCDKVMSRLKETPELKIPPGGLDAFRKDHLPHFNSTAFDINLYDKITSAMRPGIDVNINSPHVCITAKCPKRISDHKSFQLCRYKYVVEVKDKTVYSFSTDAGFTDVDHTAELPLQPYKVDGKVKVEAIYQGTTGRRVINSMPYEVKMPYYGKKQLLLYWCSPYWNILCHPLVLLAMFVIIFALSIFCGWYFPRPITNQLIAVNQTIPFQPTGFSTWCKGVSAEEYIVEYSDYAPGFDISAYLVNNSDLMTEHVTVPSDKYPGVLNLTDDSEDEQRYDIPLNYYHDPLYLLEGSVISLRCKIHLPERADILTYAFVNIFDSRDKAVSYEQGNSSVYSRVHSIDVTECKERVFTKNYTVNKNSYYFFVLTSKADSPYSITVNFTFEVNRYVNPSHASVTNIVKNSSGEIPLHHSTTILLYAHPPDDSVYRRLAHLNFTCLPNYVRVCILAAVILVAAITIPLYCWCWVKKCRRGRLAHDETVSNHHDDTTIPLLL